MANRIVMDAVQGIRVSKAGTNVLTAVSQDLLLGGNFETMGVYATGLVNPASGPFYSWPDGLGSTAYRFKLIIPNGTGSIPWVLLQQGGRSQHTFNDYEVYREINDESIPTYIYWMNGERSYFNYSTYSASVDCMSNLPGPVRYNAFWSRAGEDTFPAPDVTPNAVNWPNMETSGWTITTSDQQFSGLTDGVPIVLRVQTSRVGGSTANGYRLSAHISDSTGNSAAVGYGTYTMPPGETSMYMEVRNGDRMRLSQWSNDDVDRSTTFSVYNISTPTETLLDTCVLRTRYLDYTPNPVNWTDISGANIGTTNTQLVTGINSFIWLELAFSSPYTGGIAVNSTTPSRSVTAVTYAETVTTVGPAGSNIYWSFSPTVSFNGTVSVKIRETGSTLDTFNMNVTAAPPKIVANWDSISEHRYVSQGSGTLSTVGENSARTMSNLASGGHTMSVTLDTNPPSGTGAGFWLLLKRPPATTFSIVMTLTGTTKTGTYVVLNGDEVRFRCTMRAQGFGYYTNLATIRDVTASNVVVDDFNISLIQEIQGV